MLKGWFIGMNHLMLQISSFQQAFQPKRLYRSLVPNLGHGSWERTGSRHTGPSSSQYEYQKNKVCLGLGMKLPGKVQEQIVVWVNNKSISSRLEDLCRHEFGICILGTRLTVSFLCFVYSYIHPNRLVTWTLQLRTSPAFTPVIITTAARGCPTIKCNYKS